MFVSYLRRKLEAGGEPRLIQTVRGVGFVLREAADVSTTSAATCPRSLAGRVTLAAVAAVGIALAVAGAGVVIAAGRADRSALDRDLNQLATRLDQPAVRIFRGPGRGFPGGPPPGLDARYGRRRAAPPAAARSPARPAGP